MICLPYPVMVITVLGLLIRSVFAAIHMAETFIEWTISQPVSMRSPAGLCVFFLGGRVDCTGGAYRENDSSISVMQA